MASIYPSLEDFKYHILMNSKLPCSNIGTHLRGINGQPINRITNGHGGKYIETAQSIYPSFNNYSLGASHLNETNITATTTTSSPFNNGRCTMVAPLSGYSQAHKMQPSNTIRPVILSKDSSGRLGVRVGAIQGGAFIVLVYASSPAAMAGLKFGDQILEINDIPVAGYSMSKVHDIIKRCSPDDIRLTVRDRPFERTVTLHKDQNDLVGFLFNKHGKITSIVKDSSAARNGLLIDHNIIEINAQNVVGLKENDIKEILDNCGDVVVLTILPSNIYKQLIEQTNLKLLKKGMDHTTPEL